MPQKSVGKYQTQIQNEHPDSTFYFQKVDGSTREAWGTLRPDLIPPTQHNRKSNDTVQIYFDTESHEFRCFKKFNLLPM